MNLAYRLSYQGKIAGEMPFYMFPIYTILLPNSPLTGLEEPKQYAGLSGTGSLGMDLHMET